MPVCSFPSYFCFDLVGDRLYAFVNPAEFSGRLGQVLKAVRSLLGTRLVHISNAVTLASCTCWQCAVS